MLVLLVLSTVFCDVLCWHSPLLKHPLHTYPKGILDGTTATCEKAYPKYYTGDGCLATEWNVKSDKMCKYVVSSCFCIPESVKVAVSGLTPPNDPQGPLFVCLYLVHVMQIEMPGCCDVYFTPMSDAATKSKRSLKSDYDTPDVQEVYSKVLERSKRSGPMGGRFISWDNGRWVRK